MVRRGTPPRRPLSIRVDADLMARLEKVSEELGSSLPSFRLSLSDGARLALLEGVAVIERRIRRRRPR